MKKLLNYKRSGVLLSKINLKMKFGALFMFLALFSMQAKTTYSQKLITLNLSKVKIERFIDEIENTTDYNFVYNTEALDQSREISLKIVQQEISEVLDLLFKNTYTSYELQGDQVFLFRRGKERGFDESIIQSKLLRGTVIDEEGIPLSGVTVVINDGEKGVSTNELGRYVVETKAGDKITFSYIGYRSQTFTLRDHKVLDVVLQIDVNDLQEVVVTGYQKLSINRSTGATNTITAKSIEKKGNSNILQSLEGMIAGLGMTADPTNEGAIKFDIRGVTSLNGDPKPLVILDGFPLEADISTVNPYEVESVSVLKDAAAASIYGARAANGVIVISTKRGKQGKLLINYRNEMSISQRPNLSYRFNRVNSSDLVDIQKELAERNPDRTHTYEWYLENNPGNAQYFVQARTLVYDAIARVNEGKINQNEAGILLNKLRGIDNTKQWEENFFQSSFQQQHNLSVSGGGDKHSLRASVNYTLNKGERYGDESDRLIFDLLNNVKFSDKVNLDMAVNVVLNSNENSPFSQSIINQVNSYESIVNENGMPLAVRHPASGSGSTNSGGMYGGKDPLEIKRLIDLGLFDETYYPLRELGMYRSNHEELSARIQARLNADFTSNFTGHFDFQYEAGNSKSEDLSEADSWEMFSLINNTTPKSFNGDLDDLLIPYGSRVINNRTNRNSYTLRGQLDFNDRFGNHELSALLGSEIRHVFTNSNVTDRFGYDSKTLLFRNVDKRTLEGDIEDVYHPVGYIAGGVPFFDEFSEITNRFFSIYGNTTYGFKNRYILSGSMRIDQSNLFGTDPKFRYKPFWSVGAKWRVSEETFFNDNFINNLSLRASYGINGNVSNKYGPFNIAYALFSYRAGNVPSLAINTPAINDLRWEKTATMNVGMDVKFFNNRVGLTLDYYIKKTQDLIANGKADPTQGFSNLVFNDANITNKGFEVTLSTENVYTKSFNWRSYVTFRYNRNEVTKSFSNETYAPFASGIRNYEGAPANSFWIFNYNGLDKNGDPTILNRNNEEVVLDASFSPSNSVVVDDLIYGGTTEPIFTGSITNTINYGPFGISFMFVGSGGHVLLKDSYNGRTIGSTPVLVNKDAASAWKQPGDELFTNIPKLNPSSPYVGSITTYSTKNIVDGDFIRLRELILSYNLDLKSFHNSFLQGMTFSLRGNNLFYVAKNKEGIDPEAHGVGVRFFPLRPTYSLGVSLAF